MNGFTIARDGKIVDIDIAAPVVHKDASTSTQHERRSPTPFDVDNGHTLAYATCRDCGATFDPSKGSCGCFDNGCQ